MATSNLKILCSKLTKMRFDTISVRTFIIPPRYRPPYWYMPKERRIDDENLTNENKEFIEEILRDKMNNQSLSESPLIQNTNEISTGGPWTPASRRVGLIARKIGNYPLWSKDGKKYQTTLLQVIDNHVIKYIPPEEWNPMKTSNITYKKHKKYGVMLVGAETVDPSTVTKSYCGLFNSVGLLPKRFLCRFMVTPDAVLQTGTPLLATHFRVGDHIDVRAKTTDRGFQGVMKRHGFKGMPASHGVTKTHRRPGNIGGGGEKGRVWPGTKMPGHMGNRWRILRGVKILRINTQYNVIWTLGVAIPGETGAMCYLFDTVLPLKKHKTSPPFPTDMPSGDIPLEYIDESIHDFSNSSVSFEES